MGETIAKDARRHASQRYIGLLVCLSASKLQPQGGARHVVSSQQPLDIVRLHIFVVDFEQDVSLFHLSAVECGPTYLQGFYLK